MLVELPSHFSFHETVAPREETASSRLSLETEIDQFQLEEGTKEQGVIQVSNFEEEVDRSSGIRTSGFIVVCAVISMEEEEEMSLTRKRGLCDFLQTGPKGRCPRMPRGLSLLLLFPLLLFLQLTHLPLLI